jgi:hypothetical protein
MPPLPRWSMLLAGAALAAPGMAVPLATAAGAAEVAYVDEVSGAPAIMAGDGSAPVVALDILSPDQALVLPPGSRVRLCHYGVKSIYDLAGPMKVTVTASGVLSAEGEILVPGPQVCSEPAVSILQGGVVFRGTKGDGAPRITPSPRIRIVAPAAAGLRTVRIEDNLSGGTVAEFRSGLARPRLQAGRIYRVVAELASGEKRTVFLRAAEGPDARDTLLLILR